MPRFLFAVLVLAGCSESSQPVDPVDGAVAVDTADGGREAPPIDTSACPGGVAPDFESCEAGLFDADCGGNGEPVLACQQNGGCKWFQRGCPALGFRPIACPLGDPFCVETADGLWPYESGVVDATFPHTMCDHLDLIGDAVVTPTSGPLLEVRIDPELGPPEAVELGCEGVGLAMCDWIMAGLTAWPGPLDRPFLAFRHPSVFGDALLVELVDDPSGALAARAWLVQFTDHWPFGEDCVDYLTPFGSVAEERPVLTGGELVLTAEPAEGVELHGEATLHTAEGGTMTLRF